MGLRLLFEDFLQEVLVMAGKDDVVIAYGVVEEIGGLALVVQADDQLGAAEVGLCLISYQLSFGNKMP